MVTDTSKQNRSVNHMNHQMKRVAVSSKRQISIPKEFYEDLHIKDEIIMEKIHNNLVIRPASYDNHEDFTEEILRDLIAEGYPKEELVAKLKERRQKMQPALDRLIADTQNQESMTISDLFTDDAED